ncbi:MAG: hypothetical protein Fur0037_25080 [Planctomycetota bacterium]
MDVIGSLFAMLLPVLQGSEAPSGLGIRQDPVTGWPVVKGGEVHDRPTGEDRQAAGGLGPAAASGHEPLSPEPAARRLGSALLPVFQRIGSPSRFRELGGVTAWWRLQVHGQQGEVLGIREITQVADLMRVDRDRLEYPSDGRVYGRSGALVFAARGNLPWPTLNEPASEELALFGLLLRMPWCFDDASLYRIARVEDETRQGVPGQRIWIESRLPGEDAVGPQPEASRDRFELWCDASGRPREVLQFLACSGQKRRVLLEDWQEKAPGLSVPCRRTYVDDSGRPTSVLELLRLERTDVTERDFRY